MKNFKTVLSDLSSYLGPASCFWLFLILLFLFRGNGGSFLGINPLTEQSAGEVIVGIHLLTNPLTLAAIATLLLAKSNAPALLLLIGALLIAFYIYFPLQYKVFAGQNLLSAHALGVSVVFTGSAWAYREQKILLTTLSIIASGLYYTPVDAGHNFPMNVLLSAIPGTVIALTFIMFSRDKVSNWFTGKSEWTKGMIIASLRTVAIMILLISFKQITRIK